MDNRQFDFTDRDFNHLRELVGKHTGISLADNKKELVYGRISRRLRALKMNSFEAYRTLLENGDKAELEEFTNLITTNLTSFFREPHHFDFLKDKILPELQKSRRDSKKIRIWSAGCSTGEEPYSIAIALKEAIPNFGPWDIRILATDLDSNVLAHGKAGVYTQDRLNGISDSRLKKWFYKGGGAHLGKVKAHEELQEIITFQQLNLMGAWPMKEKFDVIFCRNVVIYFDKPTQQKLFGRFADALAPDGRMIVGHSETLNKITNRFELLGKTVYEKAA
jgi:chemotaxis protein methyltransferase CheR